MPNRGRVWLGIQVNLAERRIAIVILRARSNRIADLLPVLPECLDALISIQAGDVVRVGT